MRGGSPVMQIRFVDAGGVRAQQLALDAQNIAVSAAEVHHGLDSGLPLDELAGDLGAHAGAGARPVRHVDANRFRRPCTKPLRRSPGRRPRRAGGRISTNAHELAGRQFCSQLAAVRDGDLGLGLLCFVPLGLQNSQRERQARRAGSCGPGCGFP